MSYSRSLDELCRLGTKYALCPEMTEPSLAELKKRFVSFDWCADKATAAAFGYYAALEEFNNGKIIKKGIYEQCLSVVAEAQELSLSTEEAVDRILTLVYYWLDNALKDEGFDSPEDSENFRHDIHRLFQGSLINKEFVEKYMTHSSKHSRSAEDFTKQ